MEIIMSSKEVSLNDFFTTGQIRLAEISVFNWGSFHGLHTVSINPEGTLITGDNGSGKTTLMDGLMALLLPPGRATFNVAAAQDDKSDRNLISYVRGSYGSAHDGNRTQTKNKRTGATATALRAMYKADDGSIITLAALFWITKPSSKLSDLKRIYLVCERDLTLQDVLTGFGEGNPRALKQQLRSDSKVKVCDDRFNEYQEIYCRILKIENRNAPSLLARALGLKKIDDLTLLIRDLVLEPSSVRIDAQEAVEEFHVLNGIHDQLLEAREQECSLVELPKYYEKYLKASDETQSLKSELCSLQSYIAKQCKLLYAERVIQFENIITQHEILLKTNSHREEVALDIVNQCYADYQQAGGDRIESFKKDLKAEKEKLDKSAVRAGDYQRTAKSLDIDSTLKAIVFTENQKKADTTISHSEELKQPVQEAFGIATANYSNASQKLNGFKEELRDIEARPDSNIPAIYQRLREDISSSLDIPKNDLMFIGELIDIKEDEREWQGAIERALGGLRLTLTAPNHKFPMITKWLNTRHTKLYVRLQVVKNVSGQVDFKPDGILKKLQWRQHPYREWAKQFLARHDLHCVISTEQLDHTPYSLTKQGLIHLQKGRFEKKDNQRIENRSNWAIGFSNKSRLMTIKNDINDLTDEVAELYSDLELARKAMDSVTEQLKFWERVLEFTWEDIDVNTHRKMVNYLEDKLKELKSEGGSLIKSQERLQKAKDDYEVLQDKTSEQKIALASKRKEKRVTEDQLEISTKEADKKISEDIYDRLSVRVEIISMADLATVRDIQDNYRKQIDKERESSAKEVNNSSQNATRIMAHFSSNWEEIAIDWGEDLRSTPDYIKYLETLQDDGLPKLVEKFRERLNKHATQSLASIREKIESEREDIQERIETINDVLERTEFRASTFLRLGIRKDRYPHVQQFEQMLSVVFNQVHSEEHETRFQQLKDVIDILEKASAAATYKTQESLRLLDPRHQMSFYAEEVDKNSNDIIDVLESSSGKSGGEKESFAGIIVAASLAYVLTPDGSDKPIYSTVFLDEAFSNTSETVSRRVLRVFEELNIHINLITPFKNLNLARESARSLLIAERDADRHESRVCEITWEKIDDMIAKGHINASQQEAIKILEVIE